MVDGRTAELIARAYYVGPSSTGTCNGAAVPALFRETLDANGQPVAEEVAYGVENFQVRYGVDTNNDGSVEQYVDAGDTDLNTLAEVEHASSPPGSGYSPAANARRPAWIPRARTYAMGDVTYDPVDTANRGYRRQMYQTTVTLTKSYTPVNFGKRYLSYEDTLHDSPNSSAVQPFLWR